MVWLRSCVPIRLQHAVITGLTSLIWFDFYFSAFEGIVVALPVAPDNAVLVGSRRTPVDVHAIQESGTTTVKPPTTSRTPGTVTDASIQILVIGREPLTIAAPKAITWRYHRLVVLQHDKTFSLTRCLGLETFCQLRYSMLFSLV